jgi:hypothetical protein
MTKVGGEYMENKKSSALSGVTGILGIGVLILSIILFTNKNATEIFKSVIAVLLQADLGLLLLIFGINENRSKGRPKGNNYFVVGLVVLTSTIYTIYNLYIKLMQ